MQGAKMQLARNIRELMRRTPSLDTQTKLAKKAEIAQKTVSNILSSSSPKIPNLEVVAAIARAFRLEPWQILHPTLGKNIATEKELTLYRDIQNSVRGFLGDDDSVGSHDK